MSKRKRDDLMVSIANTIQDYQADEIVASSPEHVDRWIEQSTKPFK